MAIQNRRGVYSDFTPTKMVPGELAVVQSGDPNNTSGKAVYAAFGTSGDVKRLATEDDLSKKVNTETGKGLSTNDYTTEEKNKLSGIEAQANKTVIDATLTQTGKAADAKAVGDAIAGVTIETDKTLSVTDAPADAKVVGDELTDIKSDLSDKAPAITNTASGSIAHFEDGSDANAKSVIAHIEPVQDLHGYDSPWPAGGGKNLIDYLSCTGVGARNGTESKYNNNTSISGNILTITQTYTSNGGILKGIQHPSIAEGTSFTVSFEAKCTGTTITVGYGAYGGGGTNHISNVTVIQETWTNITKTFTAQGGDIGIFIQATADGTSLDVRNLQLELGSTATSYAPYSNICPISGFTGMNVVRTGKNLLNPSTYAFQTKIQNGLTYTVQSDGTIHVTGTATATGGPTLCDYFELPNGTYSWLNETGNHIRCAYRKRDKASGSTGALNNPFTVDGSFEIYINIYCDLSTGSYDYYLHPQIELASTATPYEPYTGSTLPITFPSEAGTVYGGYVDVTNGKLVVDRAMVIIDSSWDTAISSTGETVTVAMYNNAYLPGIASKALPVSNRFSTNIASGQIGRMVYGAPNFYLAVPTSELTSVDVAGLKSWFSSHETHVCYKLATPITYDITPIQIATLLGVNNVWNDANGDTDVEYKADTKLYIEQLTKPTEDDMVANSNIANGTFCMVGGNRLFLSTTSIAVGETIIPGTNCTELSLADALNNLNA